MLDIKIVNAYNRKDGNFDEIHKLAELPSSVGWCQVSGLFRNSSTKHKGWFAPYSILYRIPQGCKLMTPDNHKNYIHASKVLRINVGFILAQAVGYTTENSVEVPSPVLIPEDLMLEHLYISLRLVHANGGIVVNGSVETSLETECSRCVDLIPLPITYEFEEVFGTNSSIDTPFRVDDGTTIDLAPLIREETVLNVPMVTPYDETNRCLFCERTFTDILREHGLADDIDPRFEALKALKDRLNNSDE